MDSNLKHRTTLAFLYFDFAFVVCCIDFPLLVVAVVFSFGPRFVMCDVFMISKVPILNCRVKRGLRRAAANNIGLPANYEHRNEHLLACTVLHAVW